MSYTPLQLIVVICPLLASDANVNVFIDLAEGLTDGEFFGANRPLVVAYRASHMWAMGRQRPNGEVGAISSKSEGRLSVSYAVGKVDGDLDQTRYGRQLIALRNGHIPGIGVVNGSGTLGSALAVEN